MPSESNAKAARFNKDRKIQGLIRQINRGEQPEAARLVKKYSKTNAKKLVAAPISKDKLAKRKLPYETLDQLTMELLLGVR